jgi:hypothetical protein
MGGSGPIGQSVWLVFGQCFRVCGEVLAAIPGCGMVGAARHSLWVADLVRGVMNECDALHVSDLADYVSIGACTAGQEEAAFALGELPRTPVLVNVLLGDGVRYVLPQRVTPCGELGHVTFSLQVREPLVNVELGLCCEERLVLKRRERVLVPGEMVQWQVKREALASVTSSLHIVAQGEPHRQASVAGHPSAPGADCR